MGCVFFTHPIFFSFSPPQPSALFSQSPVKRILSPLDAPPAKFPRGDIAIPSVVLVADTFPRYSTGVCAISVAFMTVLNTN